MIKAFVKGAKAKADLGVIRKRVCHYFDNLIDYIDKDSIEINGDCVNGTITPLHKALPGFELLGKGYYSSVYRLNDSQVLKIVNREDRSYDSFIEFLQQVGHKYSCFPKVYLSDTWAGHKIYVIELLEEATEENEHERRFLSDYCRRVFRNHIHREGQAKVNRFVNFTPDFDEAIIELAKYYETNSGRYNLCEDLHCGNVMIRQDGTPVITDPFS